MMKVISEVFIVITVSEHELRGSNAQMVDKQWKNNIKKSH